MTATTPPNDPNYKEVLGLLYKDAGPLVFGVILYFRSNPNGPPSKPYERSDPFVVSERVGSETIVHGSVKFLLQEIGRVCESIYDELRALNSALNPKGEVPDIEGLPMKQVPKNAQAQRTYFQHRRAVVGELILLATQARNLFSLLPRLGSQKITLLDIDDNETGSITLKELCDYFVHNQYLFLDGAHISDLFPSKPRQRAPITRKFMGYRLNWFEFVSRVRQAAADVKFMDLTGLLRGRLKRLTLRTPYSDVIFLVQNVESLSELLRARAGTKEYSKMLDLLLKEDTLQHLESLKSRIKHVCITAEYEAPHIKIREELSKKQFQIRFQGRLILETLDGQLLHDDRRLQKTTVNVDYNQFFDAVNSAFGNDVLVQFAEPPQVRGQ